MAKKKSEKTAKKQEASPVLAALQKASKGLSYTSETDAPLEPFVWDDSGALTKKHLLELAGAPAGTSVEEETLDDFLHAVPPEDKDKFDKLAAVLKEQMSDIKVFKVGDEAEKQAYIVGKTSDGKWAGLKTTVVET
jgi:histidine triad (HIT) family protein